MLSCTTSPAMRVDRSPRGGALSEESLDHSDGAIDGGEFVRVELAQEISRAERQTMIATGEAADMRPGPHTSREG